MPRPDYIDVEYHLSHVSGRLRSLDQQEYSSRVQIDAELHQSLLELEHAGDFQAYGKVLFEAAFPVGSDLQRGIYSVFDASRKEKRQLRLRLNIDPAAPAEMHGLHWELLTDGRDFEVGRSPETVFSRYISQPHSVGPSPAKRRMLCVISAPMDAHRYKLAPIDYEYTRRHLESTLASLTGKLKIDFLERPITPERLRKQLKSRRYDLLHIHGHGTRTHGKESALVLEDSEHKVNFTTESALRGILLGLRDLKLVTLVACHGGEPSREDDHLSGLAGSLVQHGVPAVIAMRRAIKVRIGYRFTKILYQQLAESPHVDAAINEARHQLYMADPKGIDWSSPVLYMRLADGLLWATDVERRRFWRTLSSARLALPISSLVVLLSGLATHNIYRTVGTDEGISTPAADTVLHDLPRHPEEPIASASKPLEIKTGATGAPSSSATAIQPIVDRKVGVAAIDSQSSAWNVEVSRRLLRHLQRERSDLQAVLLPESLRPRLEDIINNQLQFLPGKEKAPGGLEHIFLVIQSHEALPPTGPFKPVSVSCEAIIASTREPTSVFLELVSHTGNGNTISAALDQALGRCVSAASSHLP